MYMYVYRAPRFIFFEVVKNVHIICIEIIGSTSTFRFCRLLDDIL